VDVETASGPSYSRTVDNQRRVAERLTGMDGMFERQLTGPLSKAAPTWNSAGNSARAHIHGNFFLE
jgi:hypothetical protein